MVFERTTAISSESSAKDSDSTKASSVDIQGLGLFRRDKGTYEPASLARSKQLVSNTISTPSTSSSPSSSLENTLRNAQALNARAVQTNANLSIAQEPPTPSPGAKSDVSVSLKDLHEYFISSVLSSVVYFLCRDHGFVPLNSRTLILAESLDSGGRPGIAIELATLDISLTSMGVLVVKAHGDMAPGLQTLANASGPTSIAETLSPGAALWLAPSGSAARFHSIADDKNLPESLSISQLQGSFLDLRSSSISTITIKSWQSRCLEWLSAKGLNSSALEAGGWLFVQILGGNLPYSNVDPQGMPMLEELAIVPWPALLCFQTSNSGTRDSVLPGSSDMSYRDPLSFAEDWFKSKEERAAILSKRQKERHDAEALLREQADIEARALQSHDFSPAALSRGSNAGAMYPTPPDAPQHLIGATPSFDGNVSTPGNLNNTISQEAGGVIPSSTSVTDAEADLWESSSKKERTSSGMAYNDNDNDNNNDDDDNENLFGDLGGDIFGTHITDDDFNFFDEPDTDQFDYKPSSPALGSLPTITETNIKTETPLPYDSNPEYVATIHSGVPSVGQEYLLEHIDQNNNPSSTADQVTDEGEISTIANPMARLDVTHFPKPSVAIVFNKEVIFQRLVHGPLAPRVHKDPRRASLFNQIDFEDSLVSVNEKYISNGQFNFSPPKRSQKRGKVTGLPQTEYLISRRKAQDNVLDLSNIAHILGEKEIDNQRIGDDPMDFLMASDGCSPVSEQDDSSLTTNEPLMSPRFGVKRKWDGDDQDDIGSTLDAMAMEFEHSVGTPQSLSGSQLPLLDADPADWSLTTYFTLPEPDAEPNILSDMERIATAQILADQAVSGSFRFPGSIGGEPVSSDKTSATRSLMHSLLRVTRSCLRDPNTCTLRNFLDIQGIPVLNQTLRLPPRPIPNPRAPNSVDMRLSSLFPIPPPQIEVRRSESKLSILPASVPFWENLGLGPAKGTKDIDAVCVYPNFDGLTANANTFLDQMRSVYESSRFGNHDRLVSKEIGNGLLPFTVDLLSQNKMHHLSTLKDTAARLCRNLSSLPVGKKNFVVYFVYPVDNSVMLVHICSAFQHLFHLYRKTLSERRLSATNELVLQLIPLDFIELPTSIASPHPSRYFQLSMEVYDRCIDFTESSSSPAIMLEQPLPRTIDFKLNVNPSASLLQENTCLHVAYAQSLDDRWITAAWTDNRGTRQMTASYCLGRKNEPISVPFTDVANEIWETTLQVISSIKIHWRVIIARVGVMDTSEIEFWTGLASTESNAKVSLTLLTVQTDPSLRLLPTPVTLVPGITAVQTVITPVSTPQALQSIVSPENAATPAREVPSASTPVEVPVEPDSDARLADFTDQSWGAILSHRLNNSNSLMETNLALISGYLIKRGGLNCDDPPIVMEVNIVHSEVVGNPRTFHESLLREVLVYYRGLGTLARTRGVADAFKDVRPWHIAAAEKAVKSLYMLM